MEENIPTSVQSIIDAYIHALEPLRSRFYGIYLYGSIAFGAFEEQESDIDIVALTHESWTAPELAQLNALHAELIGSYPLARRLEVLYLPLSHLGKRDREIAPYPSIRHGEFSPAGYGNLNSITWWTIKHKGIRLFGPERSILPFEVNWQDVLETMRDNLDGFWVSKVRRPQHFQQNTGHLPLDLGSKTGNRIKKGQHFITRCREVFHNLLEKSDVLVLLRDALVLLRDDWFVFAVVTHCRMLTTIEEGEIITKPVALQRWRDRLPARWNTLISEAWRIRYHLSRPSLYNSRLKRAIEILVFIKYVRKREGKVLEDLLKCERSDVDLKTSVSPSIMLVRREM